MKKILYSVLAAAMMLMLASCGKGSEILDQSPSNKDNSATSDSGVSGESTDVSTSFEEANGSSAESTTSYGQTFPAVAEIETTKPEVSQTPEDTSVTMPVSTNPSTSDSKPQQTEANPKPQQTDANSKPQQTTAATQVTVQPSSENPPHQHKYTKKIVEATCVSEGYTLYTCSCGDQYMDNGVGALSHDYIQTVVEPTCTTDGYSIYTCRRCNQQYESDYIYAYGHSWGTWTVIKEPTVDSEGEEQMECSVCKETESYIIPKCEYMADYAFEVVKLVNEEREKAGLEPLTPITQFNEYAMLRSTEIVESFEHVRPDGSSPLDYVMEFDEIYCVGENIAMGQSSPEAVMNAWMNSPGHRANILYSDYNIIGVGCYQYRGRLYWTQIFAEGSLIWTNIFAGGW